MSFRPIGVGIAPPSQAMSEYRSVISECRERVLLQGHVPRDRCEDIFLSATSVPGNEIQNRGLNPDRCSRLLVFLHLLRCLDRKSTRLNSSHLGISYAVFCLKK